MSKHKKMYQRQNWSFKMTLKKTCQTIQKKKRIKDDEVVGWSGIRAASHGRYWRLKWGENNQKKTGSTQRGLNTTIKVEREYK